MEIGDGKVCFLVICVYNPSRNNNITVLCSKLSDLMLKYEHTIFCGDLNIDLCLNDARAIDMLDLKNSSGLNLVSKNPTRFSRNCQPSLLDLMCVSDTSFAKHFEKLSLSGISDHELLFLCYDLQISECRMRVLH